MAAVEAALLPFEEKAKLIVELRRREKPSLGRRLLRKLVWKEEVKRNAI